MVKLNLPIIFLATSVALISGTLRGAVDESNRELQTNCAKSMDQYSLYAGKDAGTGRARPGSNGKGKSLVRSFKEIDNIYRLWQALVDKVLSPF